MPSVASERRRDASDHLSRAVRVMVLEDDENFRALVVGSLRAAGYDVMDAPDGLFALAHFQQIERDEQNRLPDLIISDVEMFCVSGLDLVRLLREARLTIPVVLMSGFVDAALETQARELGVALLLDKPFSMRQLVEAVNSCVPSSTSCPTTHRGVEHLDHTGVGTAATAGNLDHCERPRAARFPG